MSKITTAPDYAGLSVKVAVLAGNPDFPTTIASSKAVGHLEDYPNIIEANREVRKYKPINERDFEQIVSTGSVEYGSISATILYDPSGSDGVNELQTAFNENKNIGFIVELNNSKGTNGTTYIFTIRVSKFAIRGEKDGKTQAEITAEVIGKPTIKEAS